MTHIDNNGPRVTANEATTDRVNYAIRIRGTLGEATLGAFADLQPAFENGDTVLIGSLADQPALHGVLAQIEALSLELIEVRRPPETSVAVPLVASPPHRR